MSFAPAAALLPMSFLRSLRQCCGVVQDLLTKGERSLVRDGEAT